MTNLTLITLPIGNIDDFTPRARKFLQEAQVCVVEDTRNFKDFCRAIALDISDKRLISWHDHTDAKQVDKILEIVLENKKVIVASDAGSPIVSDPAYPLVRECAARNIAVETASGISAPIAALELSGLPPIPFHFHGFPPRDKGKRDSVLSQYVQNPGTHILFEGVSRVLETLEALCELSPDLEVVVARELTKQFQTIHRFYARDWQHIKKQITCKGEFVVLFYVKEGQLSNSSQKVQELAKQVLESGGKKKELSKLLGSILDLPTKDVYSKLN